ncbi:hypothetical protein [Leptospira vanthielii]|uniref:Uncharacterized protein n=1 Tax=Leptospira vanthielii serovar Holland str. Waz Holland = ATCC 700522 TaxID=1218591 RepID=N1WF45_9LEPT|nr:hypothetical protein [Leptospira vanthielii]EMY70481.1 hypothetical protein LEP1GSC199_1580 [Leptospira vanthielii serovar Holland str. Waz Holland = ATCC 700522]
MKEINESISQNSKKTTETGDTVFSLVLMIGISFWFIHKCNYGTNKNELTQQLTSAIVNKAPLSDLRLIFERRNEELFYLNETKEYDSDKILFENVLEDIKLKEYQKDKKNEEIINSINKYLETNKETHPFDGLSIDHKSLFERIRQKSGKNYMYISEDIHQIASHLINANNILERYMNRSEQSFWVSILSFIVATILGVYQIFLFFKKPK